MFAAIGVLWKIVQSERFASFVVSEVSQRFLDQESVKLDIQNVEISLFPPATDLRNVRLSVERDDFSLQVKSGRASIEFSFINLLSSDLVVDKILLANSTVHLDREERNTDSEDALKENSGEEALRDLRGVVSKIHEGLPFSLNSLQLDEVKVSSQEDEIQIHHSQLRLYDNYLIGDVKLRNLNIQSLKNQQNELRELDEVSFSLEVADNYINITDLEIKRILDAFLGEINLRSDNGQVQADLSYMGGLEWPLAQLKKNSQVEIDAKGYTKTRIFIDGPMTELRFGVNSEIHNLTSKEIQADYLNLKARYENGQVIAEEGILKHREGTAELSEQVLVYDDQNGITNKKVGLEMSNLSTGTAFHAIRDVLGIVHGRIFGELHVQWIKEDKNVEFTILDELKIRDFKLGEDTGNPILVNPEIILSQSKIVLDVGSGVYIDSRVNFGESGFKVQGRVADKEVAFVTTEGDIDFTDLGPIAGIQMVGQGNAGLKVYGPEDDVVFDVSLDTKESSLLGYELGEVQADLLYSLKEKSLEIKTLNGRQKDSTYSGDGRFVFQEGNSKYEMDLVTEKMSYKDSQKVLAPLFELIAFVPKELSFLAAGKFSVKGNFENDELLVEGPLSLNYVDFYGEVIDSLSFGLRYDNGRLDLSDILLEKGEGFLKGRFVLNTETSFLEYDGRWENIRPNDFSMYRKLNLGLETNATLDVYGSGTLEDLRTRSTLVTENSRIQGSAFGESTVSVSGQSDKYEIEGSLFEKSIVLSALIDFNESSLQKSELNASVNFSDIRDLLSILSAHNSRRDDLKGSIKAKLNSSFNTSDLKDANINFVINELDVQYKDIDLVTEKNRELLIRNGIVEKSNLELQSSGYYITPLLRGSFRDGMAFDVGYRLPFSLLELVTTEVEVSKGEAYGVVAIGGPLDKVETYAETNIENVVIQSSYIPGAIRNGRLRAVLDNKSLKVDSFQANYGKGSIQGGGQVIINFPFPVIRIEGSVSDAFIPMMSRSGMVVSGQFDLTGEEPPYVLNGDITLLFAEILEDINEFQKQQASSKSYQRFLPQSEGRQGELIELNLNINVQRPIQVRNSLLELNIDGQAQITGPPNLPRPTGRFEVVPSSSKFKFKGHEFNLTKGTIELGEDFNREGARLDFSGVTQINEYRVRLDVSGRTKNVEVSLSSEPGLSQENLFSLLTLGVTSEVSTELDENERQSVATVGLGALLADQLKLNEGLDSSFGLRLSVLPEYAEESDALLQGKSAVSESGTNRFRSSTKVRVQKKISDKVDLSVSSTVGGSLEQRQEMNVNYKFNNKWSLEGVYELKSTDDEGVESSDSIGADLKYRWSF